MGGYDENPRILELYYENPEKICSKTVCIIILWSALSFSYILGSFATCIIPCSSVTCIIACSFAICPYYSMFFCNYNMYCIIVFPNKSVFNAVNPKKF